MDTCPRLIIAGVRGGSGKTTLSLGLIAALNCDKALKVIPFKKGPDFIDAGWLAAAAKNPCYNLDPFLINREKVLDSFLSHFTGDIAVVEGNRGLYDGMDVEGSFSTAELSKILKSPVVLILDCTKMTRTSAAVVLGCMNLDREVCITGVVLNQVSGSRHESIVRASIEKYCSLPVVGAIPRLKEGEFPERHMGLTSCYEHPAVEQAILFMKQIVMKYVDMDKILEIACNAVPLKPVASGASTAIGEKALLDTEYQKKALSSAGSREIRIGVIRDTAFQFYYPENLEELRKNGAEIVDINSLSDTCLPDIDALYIGGGFPETNAIRLAENVSFRESVRNMVEKGLPVYAECGGLMFLGSAIIVGDRRYEMVGIFPVVFAMKKSPQAHGYTVAEVEKENPFYPVGTLLHGHEFHYSAVENAGSAGDVYTAFNMLRGHGIKDKKDGICYKNVLAAYTHIHALGAGEWTAGLLKKAMEYKSKKEGKV